VQTFHRIPKLVDSLLESLGGLRVAPIGLTDTAEGEVFTDFETWEDQVFWPAMSKRYNTSESMVEKPFQPSISIQVSTPRSTLRQDVKESIVIETKDLTAPGSPMKKHIEIRLPSDTEYSSGDYLAILPINPKENIHRVMRRFQLAWDSHLTITTDGPTSLPTNVSIPAYDIFGAYVELAQPATKRVSNIPRRSIQLPVVKLDSGHDFMLIYRDV
jgi:cytochrome P450 / NADPH-cytochrome P450 reductase